MASPIVDKAKERVGQVLRDKWRLDKLLGVGGSAAVYQATHVNNGKRAAVKMLHADLSTNKEVVTRFLKEGYFSNQVDHPGAVSVIDDDRAEDGSVYLVMELLEGHSLERYVRGKERLTTEQVLDYVDQVLDLLAVAHQKGILHRDIKPANVFLTNQGKIKVLDFGIARLNEPQGDAAPMTQTGTGIGTPSYMPPEQARGRWKDVDARTDVFAVGAMAYALLTGVRPRKAETGNEELLLAMTQPMPKLATVLPDIDPGVAEVVDRACEFEMDRRWPTARAMQQAIRLLGKAQVADTDARAVGRQGRDPWAEVTSPDALARAMPSPEESREPSHVTKDPVKEPSHVTREPPSVRTPSRHTGHGPHTGHTGHTGGHGTGAHAVPRVIPDGPRFKVPQLKRDAPPLSAAVPPPPPSAAVPEPPPRAPLPSIEVEVDAVSPPPPPPPELSPSRVSARKPFTSPTPWLSIGLEPQLGFLVVGAHQPEGEPPRLRAWDLRRGAVVWEALRGQAWVRELRDIRLLGPYVLVVTRQTLLALDLRTGQQQWTAQLPEKPEYRAGGEDRGPVIFDCVAHSGNLVVHGPKSLVALDAATGQERWRRQLPGPVEAWAVEGTPLLVMRYSSGARGALEILHAQAPEPLASFGTQWFTDEASVVSAYVEGGRIAARVENWGLLMAKGVLVIDAATQKQIAFEREKEVDVAFRTVPGPSCAYYVSGGALVSAGKRQPPSPGYHYMAFKLAGASLVVVLEEDARPRSYRLVVCDAATLRLRHDLGPVAAPGQLSAYLPNDPARYVLVAGEYLVFSALAPTGRTEVRCVHAATGQVLWSQPRQEVAPVDDAFLLGGMIVLRSADAIELVEPARGTVVGRYG
jgi:serine/threonine-protein kinase